MKLINKKLIIFLNIIIFCILFYIAFSFQKYFYYVYHDYFIPYIVKGIGPDFGRVPASFLYRLTKIILPDILSIHSQEFTTSIEAIIKAISFMAICIVFSLGFFINAKEKSKIFNFENLIIMPLSFFLLATPILYSHCHNMYFGQMEQSVVFFEYFFCFLFYFSFFILLIYINLSKTNTFMQSVIVFTSFFLGFWVELFNVSALFSIIIFVILLYLYNKNLLKNKNLLFFIVPFIIGMILFYKYSGYSTGTRLVSYSYNWGHFFYNIKSYFFDFVQYYIKYIFINNIWFYAIILTLTYFVWKRKDYNDKIISLVLITCFSILTGYLIMNLSLIIYREQPTIDYSGFMFQREMYQILYHNVLEFIITILLGILYFEYYDQRKKILTLLVLVMITVISIYIPNRNIIKEETMKTKEVIYDIEKRVMVFGIFGEITLLPASHLKQPKIFSREIFMFDDKYRFEREVSDYNIDKYYTLMKNRFFDKFYLLHHYYFEHEYKRPFFGVRFVDDNIANEELEKRLNLLNFPKETKEDIIKRNISFKPFRKYRNYNLTIQNINSFKVNEENKDIILKATAYAYYKDKDLDNALKLYSQYLKKYPKDIDALINCARIYQEQNKIKEAEKIYLKLHDIDKLNISFLYELMQLYYYNKDYQKALDTCDKMIEIQNNMYSLYYNKTVIYFALGNKEEANKIFEFITEQDINMMRNFLVINDVSSIEELNRKETIAIAEPTY